MTLAIMHKKHLTMFAFYFLFSFSKLFRHKITQFFLDFFIKIQKAKLMTPIKKSKAETI